jgi:hypothetical protein
VQGVLIRWEEKEMEKLIITAKNRRQYENTHVKVDGSIEISEGLGVVVFVSLSASASILAKAGSGIEAGEGIDAGWDIKAGEGIKAGWDIKAGLSINCTAVLRAGFRIFVGIALWKKEVSDEEKTITCGWLESGTVEYGILKETGRKK